jgi:hypothetical protein
MKEGETEQFHGHKRIIMNNCVPTNLGDTICKNIQARKKVI